MKIKYSSPLSDLVAELKPLFSNEYMLTFFKKFCNAIKSRTWGFKKAKNARNLLRKCLDYQLKEALYLEVISKKVNFLIGITEHSNYGNRDDKMIKGTNWGKGTKKMRHYLGFSILSRGIHLYAGLEYIAKGQPKVPVIIRFLEHLIELGFELNYVMMDREFYNAIFLHEIKGLKGNLLMPTKAYKKITKIIEEYLSFKDLMSKSFNFFFLLILTCNFYLKKSFGNVVF